MSPMPESGVLSEHGLEHELRPTIQKHLSGRLELTFAARVVIIVIRQGRIVDCWEDGIPPLVALQRLGIELPLSAHAGEDLKSVGELFEILGTNRSSAEKSVSDHGALLRAQLLNRKRILDLLHGLKFEPPVPFQFHQEPVNQAVSTLKAGVDAGGLEVPLPVTQFLVDRLSCASSSNQFEKHIKPGSRVSLGEGVGGLRDDERLVLDYVQGEQPLERLLERVPLSRFHLQESLLSLMERGFLMVSSAPSTNIAEPPSLGQVLPKDQNVSADTDHASSATSSVSASQEGLPGGAQLLREARPAVKFVQGPRDLLALAFFVAVLSLAACLWGDILRLFQALTRI